ncbi:aspartate/glutamate racemase family protein [Muricoccus pecuniae]|uniref:Asp/Glu racemase n=1 Tax=Muricoccus pecuniae TaxID=693023 RepID=A0A840YL77_9PROT|nr:aspartate/glutamate racemase family protein [Roseomonas pecuniae]MBB5695812.1 hypothetical protein [Roseomonas pecuniae]
MRLACLHTAQSNIAVFEAAGRDLGLGAGTLRHEVRADLLADAERDGGLTPEIEARTGEALLALSEGADAVLLTCSTLGPAAQAVAGMASVPVLRLDAAFAAEAVREGGKVVALCAVETTLGPTRAVFEEAARATGAEVEVRLVADAWAAFKAGERDRYLAMVAAASDAAIQDGATRVALAQASMAGAAELCREEATPLTSPAAGLAAAKAAATSVAAEQG